MSMTPKEFEDINGVLVFPPGTPIQLPDDFPPLPMNIYSEFGFKLFLLNKGEPDEQKVWVSATEEDIRDTKEQLGWGSPARCSLYNGVCTGGCAGWNQCWGIYDYKRGLIGCQCR
jgi:hypothetical protein